MCVCARARAQDRVVKKRSELEVLVEQVSKGKREMETELVSLKAELEVEATRNVSLEASKNEVSGVLSGKKFDKCMLISQCALPAFYFFKGTTYSLVPRLSKWADNGLRKRRAWSPL